MQIWLKYLELIKLAPKQLCKNLREVYNLKIKEKYYLIERKKFSKTVLKKDGEKAYFPRK